MTAPSGTTPVDAPQQERRQRRPRRPPVVAVVAGVLGEVMITLGVLVGLFVVWQLWWTDVVAGREQQQVVSELDWAVQRDEAPTAPEPDVEAPDPRRTDEAPVADEPEHGVTFATLQVPRWGTDYLRPVTQGTTRSDVLDPLGIGHYAGTAMPGEVGNFAVAGHRTTYNKPFNRVAELETGDPVVVQTQDTWYVYRVTSSSIVLPSQIDVIAPVPGEPGAEPSVATLTMTTCHPMFSARERFIVHAELDYWMPVTDGTPAEIATSTEDA